MNYTGDVAHELEAQPPGRHVSDAGPGILGADAASLPDAAWLAGVLDALTARIAVLDGQGGILAVNSAWSHCAEQEADPAEALGVGANYLDVLRTRTARGDGHAAHALAGVNAVLGGRSLQFDLEYPRRCGHEERWLLLQATPQAHGCVVAQFDITVRKRQEAELRLAFTELQQAQEQLLQSEKMASIGQLAAGVAHEINNPIGYLHSNLGTLDQYLADMLVVVAAYEACLPAIADSALRDAIARKKQETDFAFLLEDIPKLLAESRDGIQMVRKIVQSLKDFAHTGGSDDWQWTDLRLGLDRTLNIVNNELKYKAEVVREYGDIPEVLCLPGQLNQVFMNLLVNAAHAMATRGEVHVRTGQTEGEVWVEVADTGSGIAPEVIKRIFDPFFTTKPVGTGTGLGLSISYGIVKKHGGRIEVDSQVGRGTTFRVVLPVAGPDSLQAQPE